MRYRRADYLCRRRGRGLCPFGRGAGLTGRRLTPALERAATLAGAVADSFGKGADLPHELAAARLGGSTAERTTGAAGARPARECGPARPSARRSSGPGARTTGAGAAPTSNVEPGATGVRQRGPGGGAAGGRRAYVGMVCNPAPEWPWPDEGPAPTRPRYVAGLYPPERLGPLPRKPAGQVGMDQADCWIGLSDGGDGPGERLQENFPLPEVAIPDLYHPAEKLTGLARSLHPKDEARAQEQARQWCGLMRAEGAALLAAVLREWGRRPRRPGLAEAAGAVAGYLERHAHRAEYPG